MNSYTLLNQTGKAYYYNTIAEFIQEDLSSIIGQLVRHSFDVNKPQISAWEQQITVLQKQLFKYKFDGNIIFEYDIIRLGKRIDVVLLIRHMVFCLEFKNGKEVFSAQDSQQAEDYATSIKNFHKESEDLYVCPLLIATHAPALTSQSLASYPNKQLYLQKENIETFILKIKQLADIYGDDNKIDFMQWLNSPYYPTPTIIEATIEAYRTHTVSAIAKSEAGQENINACETELNRIILKAQREHKKCICFITGVPGAGKTLIGLDVASKSMQAGSNFLSVYISGNGPLVAVLRKALLKSQQEKHQKKESKSAIEALIQSSFSFKNAHAESHLPIPEHILIFDEAQRVWNETKMKEKHKGEKAYACSEPHLLYSIMDRHKDWCVIVCLVGVGQDIYDGEVGIYEWMRCGIEDFTNWELYYSPEIFNQTADTGIQKDIIQSCPRCYEVPKLHLDTSIRSFRANQQSYFIDNLLQNRPESARLVLKTFEGKYSIYVTRNLQKAKNWLRKHVRGSQRCGMIASSGALRLRAEGMYITRDIDVENWFLAPTSDIRSSNMMEVVAREFDIQGLELDWAIVGWDADFRRTRDCKNWSYHKFWGNKWVFRHSEEQKRYLINTYRVLLTRARQGMVIFVPSGVNKEDDETRYHEFYDGIYRYLKECGIQELPD